ncbi:uncharacterized protein BDR25DRAFT_241617, partial [Lindgomyces ingoldianus]
ENPDFVTFLVGPHRMSFVVPFKAIKNRAYFVGPHLNFVIQKGNGYYFDRPILSRIHPEDFHMVADFLLTDDFGRRVIENEDQRRELIDECLSAWAVAEELGMLDLMEHIANKLRRSLPWPLEEALSVAGLVHKRKDSFDPIQNRLKDLLAGYIADNFWEYIGNHLTSLVQKFKQCPELEQRVLEHRVEKLEIKHSHLRALCD